MTILQKTLLAVISILFIMIGIDKFVPFMEPPCTLEANIDSTIWKLMGVLLLIGSVLIWIPKYRKVVAAFFIIYMLVFTIVHLVSKTYDIGGALSMVVLLGLVVWNPSFLNKKKE